MNAPQLEFVCEIQLNVAKPYDLGYTGTGTRKIIFLQGGKFE